MEPPDTTSNLVSPTEPSPRTPSTARASNVPSSRVDRLLRERLRKTRSSQHLDTFTDWEDLAATQSAAPTGSGRLIVVANRLPVTCGKDAAGNWKLQISAGGLVSALMGVQNYQTIWVGWPGVYVKPGRDRELLSAMLRKEGYAPVWLESQLLDLYYNGFCNSVLWQLFHYVPLNLDSWQRMTEAQTLQTQWEAYQAANRKFGEVVLGSYQSGDMVWVQDYHLMLLPSILKEVVAKIKVGWFLHTPFPSSEIYRTLPVREEVLRAVLRADLIGFHTYDYARHFISSCTRILGLEGTPEGVEDNGQLCRVAAFPIGIDPERFTAALETEEVQANIAKLLNRYAGRKVMLGVDRLDMIKGIPQKLLAYEKLLQEHPKWRDKVLLVQIAVPSRTDVPEYQRLRSMVHEIVGRINGAFSTLTYVPIHHLDRQLSFHELCALYAVTDVALITSLRDGMNLVSYEYVACQSDNAGVLVLSEFAGAAQSLGAGALLVNPWNIKDMVQALEDALCMSEEERRERHRQNYMHVATHTAQAWADTFISELNDTHIEADLRLRHTPPELDLNQVVRSYAGSGKRLLVLGYNATLTTAVEAPRHTKRHFDQIKALTRVNPYVLAAMEELCADPSNVVVIFSGSECSKLEDTFGDLPLWLVAENGVYVRPPAASGLPEHLWTGPISNAPVEIIQGGKSVEVRPVGVTKGVAMQRVMQFMASELGMEAVAFDFVLCLGHLLARDENIYLLFEGHRLDGAQSRADLRASLAALNGGSAQLGAGGGGSSGGTGGGSPFAGRGQTTSSLAHYPLHNISEYEEGPELLGGLSPGGRALQLLRQSGAAQDAAAAAAAAAAADSSDLGSSDPSHTDSEAEEQVEAFLQQQQKQQQQQQQQQDGRIDHRHGEEAPGSTTATAPSSSRKAAGPDRAEIAATAAAATAAAAAGAAAAAAGGVLSHTSGGGPPSRTNSRGSSGEWTASAHAAAAAAQDWGSGSTTTLGLAGRRFSDNLTQQHQQQEQAHQKVPTAPGSPHAHPSGHTSSSLSSGSGQPPGQGSHSSGGDAAAEGHAPGSFSSAGSGIGARPWGALHHIPDGLGASSSSSSSSRRAARMSDPLHNSSGGNWGSDQTSVRQQAAAAAAAGGVYASAAAARGSASRSAAAAAAVAAAAAAANTVGVGEGGPASIRARSGVELLRAAAAAAAAPPPSSDSSDQEGQEGGVAGRGVRPPSRPTSPHGLSLTAAGPGGLPHPPGGEGDAQTAAAAAGGGGGGGVFDSPEDDGIGVKSCSSRRAGLHRSRSRSDLARPGRGTPVMSESSGMAAGDGDNELQDHLEQQQAAAAATTARGEASHSSGFASSAAPAGVGGGIPPAGGGQPGGSGRLAGATPPSSPALLPGPRQVFQSPRGEGLRGGKEGGGSGGLSMSAAEGGMAGGSAARGIKLPFPPRHLYTCTVGRARSKARYSLASANEVVGLMQAMVQQGRLGLTPEGSGGGGGLASYPPRWSSGGESTPTAAAAAEMSLASSWSGAAAPGPGPSQPAASSRQHSRGSGLTLNVQQLGRRNSSGGLAGAAGDGDEEDLSWHAAPSPVSLRGLSALSGTRRMSSITPSEDLPSPDSIYGCR